jgi:hypothetical protein
MDGTKPSLPLVLKELAKHPTKVRDWQMQKFVIPKLQATFKRSGDSVAHNPWAIASQLEEVIHSTEFIRGYRIYQHSSYYDTSGSFIKLASAIVLGR